MADLTRSGINPQHATWLVLFEAAHSSAEIANRYNWPIADVERILNEVSFQVIPARRRVLPTAESNAEAKRNAAQWRNRMRYLAHREHRSIARLRQEFPDYSTTVIQKIMATPCRPLTSARVCAHCGTPIQGKRSTKRFCDDRCRGNFHRNLDRSAA